MKAQENETISVFRGFRDNPRIIEDAYNPRIAGSIEQNKILYITMQGVKILYITMQEEKTLHNYAYGS